MSVTISAAECHPETCLDVAHSSGHVANVNPVGMSTSWRVDCDHCFTCVRVRPTKAEAVEIAKAHVGLTRDVFWELRNSDLENI